MRNADRTPSTRRSRAFEQLAKRAVRLVSRMKDPNIRVFFMPNNELKKMKKVWLGKSVDFVDVLSFPFPAGFPHPDVSGTYLGEIYLNKVFEGQKRKEEGRYMLIHGTLHLLGFSHTGKHDTMDMERLENSVLRRLARGE